MQRYEVENRVVFSDLGVKGNIIALSIIYYLVLMGVITDNGDMWD